MNKTLVFTATYNESENIEEFVNELFKTSANIDLLVVDDNSPDKTYDLIKNFSNKNKNIFLIKREKKLGLNTAHILGYEYALKNNYEKFITLDADMSHNPKEVPKIIDLLDKSPFVIGSRYMRGGKNDMGPLRLFISFFGNSLIKILLKCEGTEFTTSYRGFNLKKLNPFNLNLVETKGYSFFMGSVYEIAKRKFEIKEIPITFKDRASGDSKLPRIEILRTLKNLIILLLKK